MYTREQIQEIINEFDNTEFAKLKRGTSVALKQINQVWPDLMSKTKVMSYWINHRHDEGFLDSLFCEQCGNYMNNKVWGWPKYCSEECRKLNHNWRGGSEKRKQLEDKWESKYGVRNPWGSKEVRKKIEDTNLERYGAKHNWGKGSTVWGKIKQTNLDKYGTEYIVQSEHFKEKSKETMIDRYGADNPMKIEQFREKARNTNIERYGAPTIRSAGSTLLEKAKQQCMEKYGVPYYCMTEKCRENAKQVISKKNKQLRQMLEDVGVQSEYEYNVGWYSYDLHILDTKLLIDINPSFTHSITPGISNFKPKHKEYHYSRYKNAIVNGYELIQIWDWDNMEKLVQNLLPRIPVGARSCELKELSASEASKFCNNYHYQGSVKGVKYAYGLAYSGELIQVMSFGKPRYNKNYDYELLRLCTKPQFSVSGGASKLLKHFESLIKPKSLISYCDISKFSGKVYSSLGFIEQGYSLSKHWYNYRTYIHYTDNLVRKLGADKLLGTSYGKGTSNEDILRLNKFIEVYDAGQKTFVKHYENY